MFKTNYIHNNSSKMFCFSPGAVTRVLTAPDKLGSRRVLHVSDEAVTPD